jgi:mannose-6-phosphate isomerase
MSSATASILKLSPGIQDYAWGKKGASSLAAQFAKVSIPDFTINDEKTYAEVCPIFLRILPLWVFS